MISSEPAHLSPISWFDGQTLSPTNPVQAYNLSTTSNGKSPARSLAKDGLDLNSVVDRLNDETKQVKRKPAKEDGTGVVEWDPSLDKWSWYMQARYGHFQESLERIEKYPGGLPRFCTAYEELGFIIKSDNSLVYTEWIEGVSAAFLVGDFNNWNTSSHPLSLAQVPSTSDKPSLYWSITLSPRPDGCLAIPIGSEIKLSLTLPTGETVLRFPAFILHATQSQSPPEDHFRARFVPLPPRYVGPRPAKPATPRIYEAHIGAATGEKGKVGTFEGFERDVLPRVRDGGYNTLQLMGILEHPYYASFGYQVSSFFAVSSRFGPTTSLIHLVDSAHQMGIKVILDVVHSHSCSNDIESLNKFNGQDDQYFRGGPNGTHPIWGTRIFDYSKPEVIRFLLSNLHFCVDRLGFDGFRFDSVQSVIFKDHGVRSFSGDYAEYFSSDTDHEGVEYLMLANHMLSTLFPFVMTIAEDMSGFPTLCLPISIGGIGFDYRLGLGNPDLWYGLLKSKPDDADWTIQSIVASLGNRRAPLGEKTIGFVESHDQCINGDKTVAHWLFDQDIYTNMSLFQEPTARTQRAMGLHKLMRLLTLSMAGEGYLNFMGNEFGHPEWLVFPSVQNNFHSEYARRQWDLAEPDRALRFRELNEFDARMMWAEKKGRWGSGKLAHITLKDEETRLLIFTRSSHLFIFNFHSSSTPTSKLLSQTLPELWNAPSKYKVVLRSELEQGGGEGDELRDLTSLRLPPRSAVVVAKAT